MHIPGGGAIKGSNYFQKNAKPDGTYIFGCSTSVIVNVATGNPGWIQPQWISTCTPAATEHSLVYRTDLAHGPMTCQNWKNEIWCYALKTPASDLFHIWVFDKLGIKGAKPIPGCLHPVAIKRSCVVKSISALMVQPTIRRRWGRRWKRKGSGFDDFRHHRCRWSSETL